MKTFYPKHIDGGRLNINFQIGPFSVGMIQLLILALGIAVSLGIRNTLVKSGANKGIAAVIITPIVIVFLVVAFFKVSELSLLPFLIKKIGGSMIDEPIKYQRNVPKPDQALEHAQQLKALNESSQKIDMKDAPKMDLYNDLNKQHDLF